MCRPVFCAEGRLAVAEEPGQPEVRPSLFHIKLPDPLPDLTVSCAEGRLAVAEEPGQPGRVGEATGGAAGRCGQLCEARGAAGVQHVLGRAGGE